MTILFSIAAFFVIDTEHRKDEVTHYKDYIDKVAITIIDDETKIEMTFKEAAYYIMVAESNHELQAIKYNETFPHQYWNIHIGDRTMSEIIKEDILVALIRDMIYYNEAQKAGYELSEEALLECSLQAQDEYGAMTGKQFEATQYELEDYYNVIVKINLVKYYMTILMEEGYTEEELSVDGEYYQKTSEKYEVTKAEDIWKVISIGSITIN